ncbi:lipase [Capnocytophaga leadbetteri]|uniref:lipase n=1 Tax=Capnocytophaga leadbetteri TaxID=327575 RepID=UPI0028F1627B|nr:lipase [Capnocytophaga leadbetteri]
MHPKKILFFIIGVLVALFTMTLFSSYHITDSGTVREGISFGNTMLRYPTPDILGMLFKSKEKENNKLNELIKETNTIVDEKTDKLSTNDTIANDSLHKLETNVEGKIYYPGNRIDYIKRLKNKLRQGVCQIVHYGDSQIEGDRITGYVRNRLQLAFNGGGPGFFPIKVVYNQNSIDITTSGNWVRYAFFDRKQRRKVGHDMYGLFATYSRFTNYAKDTTGLPVSKATFTIKPSAKSYARLQHYTKFGLHYGNAMGKVKIKVYENGNIIKTDSLISDGKYHNYKLNFATTPKELKIELEARVSPDFYGVTLDADTGVRMDNVAMRGEAGRIFTRMNYENYRQMSVDRQPDLFIFQYGGNTIPYMKTDQQLREYVEGLIFNMKWVKRANPNAMFMLLGPGDMTTSRNGQRLTYPFLPKLNDLMKEECMKNDVAYFSMYEAMGGENSMISWVKQGMAASDYVHFSPKGTKLISEVFYQCLHNDLASVE